MAFSIFAVAGYKGYMGTAMFPPSWLVFISFFLSTAGGIMLMVFLDLSNAKNGIKSAFKRLMIYLTLTPVSVLLIWSTLAFTTPAAVTRICGDQYRNQHQISSKKINVSYNRKYWIGLTDMEPPQKLGVRVSKQFFENVDVGDSVIVEGKKGMMGLIVNRIRVHKSKKEE